MVALESEQIGQILASDAMRLHSVLNKFYLWDLDSAYKRSHFGINNVLATVGQVAVMTSSHALLFRSWKVSPGFVSDFIDFSVESNTKDLSLQNGYTERPI